MRETFTYKVYLNYYRLKTRVKRVFDVAIIVANQFMHFFLIGCFIGVGLAFGFWLFNHWG